MRQTSPYAKCGRWQSIFLFWCCGFMAVSCHYYFRFDTEAEEWERKNRWAMQVLAEYMQEHDLATSEEMHAVFSKRKGWTRLAPLGSPNPFPGLLIDKEYGGVFGRVEIAEGAIALWTLKTNEDGEAMVLFLDGSIRMLDAAKLPANQWRRASSAPARE